jgi:formate dehydrogenase iron-sulfur subunit
VSTEYILPLRNVLPQSVVFASFAGLVGVFASAMVYVDTGRPLWTPRLAFGNFFGTTLVLGSTFAAVLLSWGGAPAAAMQTSSLVALAIRTTLFAWRRLGLRAALRNTDSSIHFNARVIRELLPWTASVGTWLFAISTVFGLLAAAMFLNAAPWWTSLAALTTFGSEIIARYVFFTAGGSKRMPGGIAA